VVIVGLTGSIGMGKSTAAQAFRAVGAPVYDADAAVHRLLEPGGAAVGAVLTAFPGVARDDRARLGIDRGALGSRVFGDTQALARLESILHPLVRAEERRFLLASQTQRCRLVVLDIPLLYETGGEARCDATVVVSAPLFVQRARVLRRGKMTEARFAAILARQMPDLEKRRRADFVIPTGLDKRASRRTARRIAARLAHVRGTHWPHCWSQSLGRKGPVIDA
jgi:dephospho-CoA kinase